jgi:hypothetical protein
MAANSVQFHKERSLREFLESYGTGAQCAAAVFEWRWVQGFARSECGHAEVYSRVQIRGSWSAGTAAIRPPSPLGPFSPTANCADHLVSRPVMIIPIKHSQVSQVKARRQDEQL